VSDSCPGRAAAFFTLLRRAGTATNIKPCTGPALQRTASQELRAALRPGNVSRYAAAAFFGGKRP
jgi:hypothetical protein